MSDNVYAPPKGELQIEKNDKLNPLFLTATVFLAVLSLVQFRIELIYVMEYSNNSFLSWLDSSSYLAAKLSMACLLYFAFRRAKDLLVPLVFTWLLFLFNTSLYYFRLALPTTFGTLELATLTNHLFAQVYFIASMAYLLRRKFKAD